MKHQKCSYVQVVSYILFREFGEILLLRKYVKASQEQIDVRIIVLMLMLLSHNNEIHKKIFDLTIIMKYLQTSHMSTKDSEKETLSFQDGSKNI